MRGPTVPVAPARAPRATRKPRCTAALTKAHMTSFRELRIAEPLVAILDEHSITTPFPIQEQAIPLAMAGKDILGQAKTGTGKTLAYGLPILERLGERPEHVLRALVVVPTRELAVQVHDDLSELATARGARIAAIYGGHSYEDQISALTEGSDIVAGTPGRLLDLQKQGVLDLSTVQIMVLDEADKMLDLGFLPDVERIFDKLPAERQTMLFSATMPGPVIGLSRRFMNHPVHIHVAEPDEGIVQANIKQFVYRAHPLDKPEIIARILQADGRGRTIIFTRTKRAASRLAEDLAERGFRAIPVHGDLTQEARERNLHAFRAGDYDVLVATDVAARGIDVDDVTHVINHSIPEDEQDYLHRIGRTGRAGKTGTAVTFVDWQDVPRWKLINDALEFGQPDPTETYSTSAHLFSDLHIPGDADGRLAGAKKPSHAQHSESRRRTDSDGHTRRRTRSRSRTERDDAHTGTNRRRRRPRNEETHPAQVDGAAPITGDAGQNAAPVATETAERPARRRRSGERPSNESGRRQRRSDGRRDRSGRRDGKVVLKSHELKHGALAGGSLRASDRSETSAD